MAHMYSITKDALVNACASLKGIKSHKALIDLILTSFTGLHNLGNGQARSDPAMIHTEMSAESHTAA